MSAALANLIMFQVAGGGVAAPIAWIHINDSNSIVSHAEAWNPDGVETSPYDLPVIAGSTGLITITYNTQYPDETGTLQALDFKGVVAHNMKYSSSFVYVCNAEITLPNKVSIAVNSWEIGSSSDFIKNQTDLMVVIW
jgi:hypothetical protein